MKEKFVRLMFERSKFGKKGNILSNKRSVDEYIDEHKNSIKRGYRDGYYSYAPVIKFLNSKVGKCWDDVYSEMSTHFNGYCGHILKNAIDVLVEKDICVDDDGDLADSKGKKLKDYRNWYRNNFYINPKTNTLEKIKAVRIKYRRYKQPKTIIRYNGKKYYKYKNIWYEVETTNSNSEKPDVFYDIIYTGYYRNLYKYYCIYGEHIICISKKQANARICRKLNAIVHSKEN